MNILISSLVSFPYNYGIKICYKNPVSIMCLHLVGVLEIIDLFGVYVS